MAAWPCPLPTKVVTEISCHARGASWLFPATGVVLDIGGQDSKVIAVEDGAVQDFVMNDKCAAGTGRFLQVLSGILGMELPELGQAAATGKPVSISSMCAVFAETEIIGAAGAGDGPGRHRCGGIPVHRTPYAGAGSTYPAEGRMHLYRWAGYQSGIQRTACGGAGSTGQCP